MVMKKVNPVTPLLRLNDHGLRVVLAPAAKVPGNRKTGLVAPPYMAMVMPKRTEPGRGTALPLGEPARRHGSRAELRVPRERTPSREARPLRPTGPSARVAHARQIRRTIVTNVKESRQKASHGRAPNVVA